MSLLFVNCNNVNTAPKKINTKSKVDSINVMGQNNARYKLIKYNFYINIDDDLISFKKYYANEIDKDFVYDSLYDGTLYVYKNDSNITKTTISNFIDTQSISLLDNLKTYYVDKHFVYYFHGTSDGGDLTIISGADPKTFRRISNSQYVCDNKYVYYQYSVLPGLIPKETVCLSDTINPNHDGYIKDKKIVYYELDRIDSADANSFKLINDNGADAMDKKYFYKAGQIYKVKEK